MLILALEQSSDQGGMALLHDEKILGEKEWNCPGERSGGLFVTLRQLLAGCAVPMDEIETYVVDAGPGSYSGLRVSMAAARAFALPDKKPVYAVTSAETLAFEIMNENSGAMVQVVGDARRQQWWTGVYRPGGNIPLIQAKLCLTAENDFHPVPGALLASPDWHRIGDRLKALPGNGKHLIAERKIPRAGWLGRLAFRKLRLKMEGEPLAPLYLHAAVNA